MNNPIALTDIRPELLAFVLLMEQRLRDHDADKRQSWKEMSEQDLAVHLTSKTMLLDAAVRNAYTGRIRHAVDLANFAMMIVDVAGGLPDIQPNQFDLVTHLHRQRAFSERTFGPGERTAGVLDHIRKELIEIEADPHDVSEWVDVILLALDGAWRHGHEPEVIAAALNSKQDKNERRQWPDWRTVDHGKAIEHVHEAEHE